MWMANSAVVSPSADTKDKKVHFTPANLQSYLHRSLEAKYSSKILKILFPDPSCFVHHPPLPSFPALADEGSANHNRLCLDYHLPGVEVFIYGRDGFALKSKTKVFYPRQSQLASQLTSFRHKLKTTLFFEQNPEAIDAGVFHNDVICVADRNLIFYHEKAFVNTKTVIQKIKKCLAPHPLFTICVSEKQISLKDAVSSYLFNSQLLALAKNKWLLLAPLECEKKPAVKQYLKTLPKNLIKEVCFVPLSQSMQNGGGPACLRLRVVLTKKEAQAIPKRLILTPSLYQKLKSWINKHYRESLTQKDLLDPLFVQEIQTGLNKLSEILQLKNLYDDELMSL